MTGPSSTLEKTTKSIGLIRALILLAAAATIIIVLWALGASQADPYVKATLDQQGSAQKGSRLFRMNCAGCHGISAQGLLGPNLHEVASKHTDAELIHQVVEGRTPPMPSFELEPQAMADILSYLHSLKST